MGTRGSGSLYKERRSGVVMGLMMTPDLRIDVNAVMDAPSLDYGKHSFGECLDLEGDGMAGYMEYSALIRYCQVSVMHIISARFFVSISLQRFNLSGLRPFMFCRYILRFIVGLGESQGPSGLYVVLRHI